MDKIESLIKMFKQLDEQNRMSTKNSITAARVAVAARDLYYALMEENRVEEANQYYDIAVATYKKLAEENPKVFEPELKKLIASKAQPNDDAEANKSFTEENISNEAKPIENKSSNLDDKNDILINDSVSNLFKRNKKYDIFISYRRAGGELLVKLFYDKIKERGYRVFYDVDGLKAGHFDEQIYDVIDNCTDFLLLCTPNALDRCIKPDGTADHNDWVFKEIYRAYTGKKNIIPVLINNFEWPKQLPSEIEDLNMLEGVTASNEFFDYCIDTIVNKLMKSRKALSVDDYQGEKREYYKIKLFPKGRYKTIQDTRPHIFIEAFLSESFKRDNKLHNEFSFEEREWLKRNIDAITNIKAKVQFMPLYNMSAFAMILCQFIIKFPNDLIKNHLNLLSNICAYLLNISQNDFYEMLTNNKTKEQFIPLYKNYLPLPFDVLLKSNYYSEKTETFNYVMFDCMLDLYDIFKKEIGEQDKFVLGVRWTIKSYAIKFHSKHYYLPKRLQKRISEL